MAPKLDLSFDHKKDITDDEPHDVSDDECDEDCCEYGYLQVDDYRSHKVAVKRNLTHKCIDDVLRWVPLPRGTFVQGYSEAASSQSFKGHPVATPMPSALKRSACSACSDMADCDTRSRSSSDASTAASSGDIRHVHFRDGCLPGCWKISEADAEDMKNDERNEQLADWFFIDRDICGFSLHEYDPDNEAMADFASSPYALMFFDELDELEDQAMHEQHLQGITEADRLEERFLDKALLLAGVRVDLLHTEHHRRLEEEFFGSNDTQILEVSI